MNEINSNTIRFIGLSSGLDVDSIVSTIISAEEVKIDSMRQKKTSAEWKSDELKNVNLLVSSFMDKYFSAASPDTNMNISSSYLSKKVNTTDNKYVTITPTSSATEDSYVIDSISSLATASKAQSSAGISKDSSNKISTTSQLKDLDLNTPLVFNTSTDAEGNVQNTISFNISGVDFQFKDTDTLQTVMNTVNRSSAGVTMSYSSLSDKISIKSKTTGSDSNIEIINKEGNFFADLSGESAFGISTGTVKNGTNAVLSINGYRVEQSTNNFTIDGISYNLLGTTNEEIDFTVSQDIDSIYNKISGFINGYNELITTLNSKISEEKYRTYLPLTDSQEEEMSENEITLWNEKAKSGILKNDSRIRNLLSDIRNAFVQTVEDAGISFSEIGISTGNWAEKGKLHIDETKLRNALANNADQVKNLFLNTSTATDKKQKYGQSGLIQRINESMNNYIKEVKSGVLDQTTKQITSYTDKITDALERLNEKEEALYDQYAALESALSELSSQSSYFSSMLGN